MLKYRVGAHGPVGRGPADQEPQNTTHHSELTAPAHPSYVDNTDAAPPEQQHSAYTQSADHTRSVQQTQSHSEYTQSVDHSGQFHAGHEPSGHTMSMDQTRSTFSGETQGNHTYGIDDTLPLPPDEAFEGHAQLTDVTDGSVPYSQPLSVHIQSTDDSRNVSPDPRLVNQGLQEEQNSYREQSMSYTDVLCQHKFREGVTETDLLQIETFYRSHKTEVFVCASLANLYFGSARSGDEWKFTATGIPLLLLDTGEHHRQRKLSIILAEKGTGFTLWRDIIDGQTCYKTPNPRFHTMRLSTDYTKQIGFSFDEADKAQNFYSHLETLISDPDDALLGAGKHKKKKSVRDKKKVKLPKKSEISQPCCFVHVTKLDNPAVELSTKNTSSTEISEPLLISASSLKDDSVKSETT